MMSARRPWCSTEVAVLHQYGPVLPWPELEALLPGRSQSAIQTALTRHGIRRRAPRPATRPRRWTPTEDELLHQIGPSASWPELTAAFPDRSQDAIGQRIRHLGLHRPTPHPWTLEEDALLRHHGASMPWPELETLLPTRTQDTIRRRMRTLGIHRTTPRHGTKQNRKGRARK